MARPNVFVTRVIPDAGLERIRAFTDAEVWEGEEPPPYEVLLEKAEGLDGLVCLLTDRIDVELMDAAGGSLKVISQMAVGFDNIDVAAATERGIPVGNTPGVLTETTADFAFALLMVAARRIVEGERYVKAGKWVIVPHIASSSLATRSRMATMAAENLEAGLKGEKLPHCANSEVYR